MEIAGLKEQLEISNHELNTSISLLTIDPHIFSEPKPAQRSLQFNKNLFLKKMAVNGDCLVGVPGTAFMSMVFFIDYLELQGC